MKLQGARLECLKERRSEEYDAKNNKVKQSAREDNRGW